MSKPSNIKIYLFYLIAISTLIRCLLASVVELGGEEAYCWTYALYPKLSNLDHPPMIGWFIQLFTNNLLFNSTFITRYASIFIGSINIWIVFILGRRMNKPVLRYTIYRFKDMKKLPPKELTSVPVKF